MWSRDPHMNATRCHKDQLLIWIIQICFEIRVVMLLSIVFIFFSTVSHSFSIVSHISMHNKWCGEAML